MGGTLLVGGTTLLLGGVTLLEDGILLANSVSPVGTVWQAVNKSSMTNANKADKKRYFFIESQPFTRIRNFLSSVYIINAENLSSQQQKHYSLYTKSNSKGRADWHAPLHEVR